MSKVLLLIMCLFLSVNVKASTIYLMRHAEKSTGKDPQLTVKGKKRAQQLAHLLQKANITHIFSSQYQRTIQTAQPLADILGIKIEIYDPRKLKEFADKLKHMNGTILVIGHSNTTPQLTQMLSNQIIKLLTEADYGDLYQVTMQGNNITVQHLMVEINN